MNIDEILTSASCDLKISVGHARNGDIEGQRKCINAALKRMDDVIAFCDQFDIERHYKLDNMIHYATELMEDLHDSETMLAYFNGISTLPNARTEGLI